jgi:LacI family transcriptional regulator
MPPASSKMQTDVALKAGVSQATVSRVLSNKNGVNAKTRLRVLAAVEELGFRSNANARALVSGRTQTIGIAIRDLAYLSASCISSIISGIAEASDQLHYATLFCTSMPRSGKETEYLRIAKEGRIDGMIVVDQLAARKDLNLFRRMNIPLVLVDNMLEHDFPHVRMNYRRIVAQAVDYLISLGHRRIALVPERVANRLFMDEEMLAGYKDALARHGLPFMPELLPERDLNVWDLEDVRGQVERILVHKPTAFLCLVDVLTFPLYQILTARGLRIPQDVSLMGYSAAGIGSIGPNPFALIKIPGSELGMKACQLLMDVIEGMSSTREIILDAQLALGESCAAPPAS